MLSYVCTHRCTCVVLDQCWLFYTLRFFVCSFKYVLRRCVTASDRCVMRSFCKPGVCAHALVCERNKNQAKYITTRTITVTVTQRPVQKINLSCRRKKTIESSKSCWLTATCCIMLHWNWSYSEVLRCPAFFSDSDYMSKKTILRFRIANTRPHTHTHTLHTNTTKHFLKAKIN